MKYLPLILVLMLAGCATKPEVHVIPEPLPRVAPANPRPIVWQDVQITQQGDQYVMDDQNHKRLQNNLAEAIRYIKQLRAVVSFYQDPLNKDSGEAKQ